MVIFQKYVNSLFRMLLASAVAATLSACATNGVIRGTVGGQPVQMNYHHTFWHQNGEIVTVMPNGERYTGKFVVGTSSTTGIGVGIGSGDAGVFTGTGNTSQAAAVLTAGNGNAMHCQFTLAKPDAGLEGGGVGYCKSSTGQTIDATF